MRTIIIEGKNKRSVAEVVVTAWGAQREARETTADLPGLSFAETFQLTLGEDAPRRGRT